MRVTLRIPDALAAALKRRAAERGMRISALAAEVLARELDADRGGERRTWPPGSPLGAGRVSSDFADAVAAGRSAPLSAGEEARAAGAFDDGAPASV